MKLSRRKVYPQSNSFFEKKDEENVENFGNCPLKKCTGSMGWSKDQCLHMDP